MPTVPNVQHVSIASEHNGAARQAIHVLKFARARAAAHDIAAAMSKLCDIPNGAVLVPIPTASSHIRARGYDQTLLIARRLAKIRGLPCLRLLSRQGQVRQVGASRRQRQAQLAGVFSCTQKLDPAITYVLIDDVLTTGSTIEHAAGALRAAGAARIHAATFAYQPLQ